MNNKNETESRPIGEPEVTRNGPANVEALQAEINGLKETIRKQEHDLRERAKELSCLYGIASIVNEPRITLDEVLQGIVNLLPGARQHSDVACSRIIYGIQEFRTDNFKETSSKLAASIISREKLIGAVETFYLEDMLTCAEDPFLKEERNLIDAIARRLGKLIEQKTTEADIRSSEEKYRLLVENSHDVRYTLTPEGIFTFVSPSFDLLIGYPAREAAGKSFHQFVHPEDVEKYEAFLKTTIETGERQTGIEYRVLHADGSCRWHVTNAVPLTDDAGKIIGFQGCASDITERKRAEMRLRASEEMLNTVFDQTFQFMGLLDTEGRVVIANKVALDFVGQTESDVIGKPFWETPWWSHSRREQDRVRDAIIKVSKGKSVGFETTHVSGDGVIRQIDFSLRPSRNETGEIVYLSAEGHDITDIKEKEAALVKSEQKYRNIFENAVEGIFQSAPEGRFIDVNPTMAKMCGYESPEEMISSITDIKQQHYVDPEERERFTETIGKQGTAVDFETQIYRKDHTKFWVSVNSRAAFDSSGKVLYYEGICVDITERRLAQEEIARERERLRTLSDSAPFGMVLVNDEGKITYINDKFTELFGYYLSDVPDNETWFSKAFPNESYRRNVMSVWAEDVENIKPGTQNKRIFTITCKDGTQKIVSFSSSLIASRDYLVTCEDITQLRHLESSLRHAQKMESVGTLAGGIAHDFNNILTALMGYATLVQMKAKSDSSLKPYVDQIILASQKAADLTQNLLTFSRKQPVDLVSLNINETIEATQKLLKRLLTEDIELCMNLTREDTIVMADRSQIDQVLFNLAANARDAMPKGGMIVIETSIANIDSGFVDAHGYGDPGRYVLISISDTGVGMNETILEKIFDPFFTTKETGKGTGLGLATVYGIVKQHNGFVNVYSEPGRGTTFRIYLPSVNAAVDQKEDESVAVVTGNEIILIAEDDEPVRTLIRDMLDRYGYKTIESVDGEDAIEKFRQHPGIDLVILDSVMPRKNGRETYEEMHGMNPRIKVIFTSGYTRDIVLDKGIEDGSFDFISKPLSVNELLLRVRKVLDA